MRTDRRDTPDPESMIARAKQGDAKALASLLELYRNYLAVLARIHIDRQLQAKIDPSDLVQETCLDVYRNFGRFRGSALIWRNRSFVARSPSQKDA
jgi:RNA polymerase sigma-70 factor (ECF subfamily)